MDTTEAGVMGHSRGTATALLIAGGSTTWGIAPNPRIKGIIRAVGGGRHELLSLT